MIRILFIVFSLYSCVGHSQNSEAYYHKNSSDILDSLLTSMHGTPQDVAEGFMGYPYKSHSLDVEGRERLIVDFSGFDCVTLVENSIALSRSNGNKDAFLKELSNLRYRNGTVDGYLSRLHYFSEWIRVGIDNGILQDITKDIGGKPFNPNVTYMSQYPDKYPKLIRSSQIDSLQVIEKRISALNLYYLPKEQLMQQHLGIKDGDIIAIVTSIEGLDITHVGFSQLVNKTVMFLHASSEKGKVMCSNKSLKTYLSEHKHMIGIIVLRIK